MESSELYSPIRGIIFLVTILSTLQFATTAPTLESGTSVSSAPNPLPNLTPSNTQIHVDPETILHAGSAKDELKKRESNISVRQSASIDLDAANNNSIGSNNDLAKRQFNFNSDFTRGRSNSAPARIGSDPPNVQDEQNAIADAANNFVNVAEQAVQNAAIEQQQGFNNPNFAPSDVQTNNGLYSPVASPVATLAAPWSPPAASVRPVVDTTYQQPAAVIPAADFQVLDGTLTGPLKDNAQQPKSILDDLNPANNGANDAIVLDGTLQNPLEGDAQQPVAVILPVDTQSPDAFNPASDFQVLDGTLSGPLQGDAQQPEDVLAGLNNNANPSPDNSFVVLDGTLSGPLEGNAQQPENVLSGVDLTGAPNIPPNADFTVLDGTLQNPLQGDAQQPEDVLSALDNSFQVLDGTGQPLQNGALQPEDILSSLSDISDIPPPADFSVLDGTLQNPLEGDAQQPENVLQGLVDPFQVLDGTGQPLQNGALQPERLIPTQDEVVNQLSQTLPGQAIQNADDNALPAIVSTPDLWQQVIDTPNVQQFLQGNDPASLQPFLQPETRRAIEQDPNSASSYTPGLTNYTPDQITDFANFVDSLPPNQQTSLINNGPAIADIAQNQPNELSDVLNQAANLETPQPFESSFNNNIPAAFPEPTVFGGGVFTPNGFEQNPVGPDAIPPFAEFPNPQAFPNSNGEFIPNGFQEPSTGPGAFGPFQPNAESIYTSPDSGIPTNLLLQNGGVLHFNCVPVFTDANGVKYPAAEVQAQALNSLNLASYGAMNAPPTNPNLLNEVVLQDNTGDIVSASQIDGNTVLVNTDQVNDSEQIYKDLQDGWTMKAEDTDGVNGFDRETVSNGGVDFIINNPNGIPTDGILGANTVGGALDVSLGSDARISVESTQY
ncbi:hypothetical protein ABW21_db0200127 [Orbilia brochopaga]|nr:hypothetical protein ABW21_db0200127 [Drechslerella brochopaga]